MAMKTTVRKITKKPSYLGRHTACSWIAETKKFHDVPYLRENNGKLPPFILTFGDRRRVIEATKILGLRNVLNLHDEGKNLFGLDGIGRVNVSIGVFGPIDQPLPILLLETQMGCPSTQINLREILTLTSTEGYSLPGRYEPIFLDSTSIFVIRAGTSGGINNPNISSVNSLSIGELVVAKSSLGHSGAILQSMGILNPFSNGSYEEYISTLLSYGIETNNGYPYYKSSRLLMNELIHESVDLGFKVHVGNNFSKDSLYSEVSEDIFIGLRTEHNVLSTEMEQVVIAYEAARFKALYDINIQTALISCVVGLIPGGSFPSNEVEQKNAKKSEKGMLKAAAQTLHNLVYGRSK